MITEEENLKIRELSAECMRTLLAREDLEFISALAEFNDWLDENTHSAPELEVHDNVTPIKRET